MPHHRGEELKRIGSGIGRVRIGEELANVTTAAGAQDGVGQGVREHVGVTVAEQALTVRDIHATDDAAATLHQPMHVVSMSDAQTRCHAAPLSHKMHGLRIYPAALFRFTSGLDDRSHLA